MQSLASQMNMPDIFVPIHLMQLQPFTGIGKQCPVRTKEVEELEFIYSAPISDMVSITLEIGMENLKAQ